MSSISSQLRERVRIEQPTRTNDGFGGKTVSWTTLATVFAKVEPVYVAATEREIAAQRSAKAGYRVSVRLRTDIDASMRLVWKSRTLTIHSLHEQDALLILLTYEENV